MTATAAAQSKITYTSADVDWDLFHRRFDDALALVRSRFGRDYPLYIGGEAVTSSAKPIVDTSPIDTRVDLGNFATATALHVDQAVVAARAAQAAWGDIARFFDAVEAGVCYVNKRTGATTGAWPGAQPFTGWKGSGSTGEGGCGPSTSRSSCVSRAAR